MTTTEYHVQLHKSEINGSGQKELRKVYPITHARDIITKGIIKQPRIESETLRDILANLGNMAFQDIYQDATESSKGIVQVSNNYRSSSTATVPTSKALNDLFQIVEADRRIIEDGIDNGTFLVNGQPIKIGGLGSAAYHNETDFATSEQGALADGALQRSGGTMTGPILSDRLPESDIELANKLYIDGEINAIKQEITGGVVNKGVVRSEDEIPTEYTKNGWRYTVGEAGTYCGYECKVGDVLMCKTTGENTPKTRDNWDLIPSANEKETFIRFSTEYSNVTEEPQTGDIVLGEAATRQISRSFTSNELTDELTTVEAIVRYIKAQNFARKSDLTKVKGAKEETWRGGEIDGEVRPYVNLTPQNIGAATEEQGEKADSAIQKIVINSVTTGDEGTAAEVIADTDDVTRVTRLDFKIPMGYTGPTGPQGMTGSMGPTGFDGAMGPTGPTGPQGISGTDGSIGPTGPIGSVGPTGPRGVIGQMGPTGPQGPRGEGGTEGSIGPTGPQGATGLRGNLIWSSEFITGTSTTPTIFPTSGITEALIGDINISPITYDMYRCTSGGDQTVAKWIWVVNLKADAITVSSTKPTSDGIWYETK